MWPQLWHDILLNIIIKGFIKLTLKIYLFYLKYHFYERRAGESTFVLVGSRFKFHFAVTFNNLLYHFDFVTIPVMFWPRRVIAKQESVGVPPWSWCYSDKFFCCCTPRINVTCLRLLESKRVGLGFLWSAICFYVKSNVIIKIMDFFVPKLWYEIIFRYFKVFY